MALDDHGSVAFTLHSAHSVEWGYVGWEPSSSDLMETPQVLSEMQPLGHLCLGERVEKILLGAVCFAGLGKELSVRSSTVSFQTVNRPMSAYPHTHTVQLWASMEPLGEYNLPLFSHRSSFLLCQQLRDLVQDTCKHLVGFPSAILGLVTLRRQEVYCEMVSTSTTHRGL